MPQQADRMRQTMAQIVEDRKSEFHPGRTFVEACAVHGLEASVEFDVTITGALTSSRRKPRHPARNMLKVVDLSRDPRQFYWHEGPAEPGDPDVTDAELRREATNHFRRSPIPDLLPTTAWVQVPEDLWKDPETFENFINYRLIVRLGTAENQTIIRGEGGLLNFPGIGQITSPGRFSSTLLTAVNEAEQMGGTADGMIINPEDYYRFLGHGPLMQDLDANGVFIVRTRLVDPGTAIVGDFGHGAQLFDAGRSVIAFAEPPPGTFAEPGIAMKAEIYERVVVNLPTNFFIVSL
ncbi:MAG: family 3 encapsulin nanocompartment shell protein [Streptosporangiaceae bacterium]